MNQHCCTIAAGIQDRNTGVGVQPFIHSVHESGSRSRIMMTSQAEGCISREQECRLSSFYPSSPAQPDAMLHHHHPAPDASTLSLPLPCATDPPSLPRLPQQPQPFLVQQQQIAGYRTGSPGEPQQQQYFPLIGGEIGATAATRIKDPSVQVLDSSCCTSSYLHAFLGGRACGVTTFPPLFSGSHDLLSPLS